MIALIKEAVVDLNDSSLFFIFLFVVMFDIICGKVKAFYYKELNSYIGVAGLMKHILVIILQVSISIISRVLGYKEVATLIGIFYITDYVNSIYANLVLLGIPLPELELVKEEIRRKRSK